MSGKAKRDLLILGIVLGVLCALAVAVGLAIRSSDTKKPEVESKAEIKLPKYSTIQFRDLATGKTEEELLALFGRPARAGQEMLPGEPHSMQRWRYVNAAFEPVSLRVIPMTTLMFMIENGKNRVVLVTFD